MSEPYDPGRVKQVAGYGGYCVHTVQCTHVAFLHDLDLFKSITPFLLLYASDFQFPLAFQCCIPNCSIAKTREAKAKTRHKVKNDGKGGYDAIYKHATVILYYTRPLLRTTFWLGSQNVENHIILEQGNLANYC